MTFSRRGLCLLATALAASWGRAAQTEKLHSTVFPYDELPVRDEGGNKLRPIINGELPTGIHMEVRETRLPAGAVPHPPHHHPHDEMFLIREGTLEVTIKGRTTRLGPGSAGFVAGNDEHGARNGGTTPVEYFIIKLGKDA